MLRDHHGNAHGHSNRGVQGDAPARRHRRIASADYRQITSLSKYAFVTSKNVKELSIEGNRVKILHPEDFEMLNRLKMLSLKNNRIKMISVKSFMGLKTLEEVDLSDNHIRHLPKTVFLDAAKLKKIKMHNNRLRSLPPTIFKRNTLLEYLDLSDNKLRDIPDNVFRETVHLKELNLEKNHLRSIRPSWFQNTPHLTKLNLNYNQIVAIPPGSFEGLGSLRFLHLSYNKITRIPRGSLAPMADLEELDIIYNNISIIDDFAFQNNTSLRDVNLDHNSLEDLKDGVFYGTTTIKNLGLSHNRLRRFRNETIGHLIGLQTLDASYNQIKVIKTHTFYGLFDLSEVKFDHNEIKTIEDEAFLVGTVNNLSKLTWLYLQYNKLKTVTSYMFYGLPYLKFMNVGQNKIEKIEEYAFKGLRRLHTIMLNDNAIGHLETGVFQTMDYLNHLNLANNMIKDLTFNIFLGLENLEEVNLESNKIARVTADPFLDTPRLVGINLKDNEIRDLDLASFESIIGLRYLDLTRNRIKHARMPNVFQHSLRYLSLADNSLVTLDGNITRLLTDRGLIHLYGNPWTCDCHMAWFSDYSRSGGPQLANKDDIICKAPVEESGRSATTMFPEEFVCAASSEVAPLTAPQIDYVSLECPVAGLKDYEYRTTKLPKKQILFWHATIVDENKRPVCSGALVYDNWVLTRPQCWNNVESVVDYKVYLGEVRGKDKREGRMIKKVIMSSNDDGYGAALVQLVASDSQKRTYKLPCIADVHEARKAIGRKPRMVSSIRAIYPERKRKIKLRSITIRAARRRSCGDESTICVKEYAHKLTNGTFDTEGAPLYADMGKTGWALVGFNLNNHVRAEQTTTLYHVFRSVAPIRYWIEQTIRGHLDRQFY